MSLAVLGRPRLKAADAAWITALRDRHGKALATPEIGPHVTLVFPTGATDATTATGHLAMVAGETPPLDLAFRCALPVPDPDSGDTFVYLVPDEGFSTLVRLHDRLYSGPFAEALRLDLPYIPHITLGRIAEAKLARALADDLNGQEPEIGARLETVELFRLDGKEPARRLAEVALRG
ncbi:MAG: 2'-5' RNA ligase family protein [Thalassobaculum sp.]|uniref:2'-5' RNA ligase family protein n=1 Tax=Thalassobaculum sp. TaxID=2022740 RepID=UPI0032EC4231